MGTDLPLETLLFISKNSHFSNKSNKKRVTGYTCLLKKSDRLYLFTKKEPFPQQVFFLRLIGHSGGAQTPTGHLIQK
jgi:hypothetical protein